MEIASCSFLRFVYPFTFRAETFHERVRQLDGDNGHWTHKDFPVGETLSHVAAYLKPDQEKEADQAARQWELSKQNHNPLRLTGELEWGLLVKNKAPLPFRFGGKQKGDTSVELALFGIGVGFLTVTVRPTESDVDSWLAFLHYFRVMNGSHDVSLSVTPQAEIRRPSEFTLGTVTCTQIKDKLLNTVALPHDGSQPWWHDVFVPGRMIPFAALFVDGMAEERARAELLYRVRNFFRAEQPVIAADEDLQVKGHPALMPYAQGQQFLLSLEGGSFVAFDAPEGSEFFRKTLPDHLRDQYFLVFLLALHQRFALTRLSQRVAGRWAEPEDERFARFEHIREDFLAFSARGYFVQVMQREHHDRFYRKWHEIFQMDRLYQEVRDEVREMHEYLRMKQAERIQELQEAQNGLIARFGVAITLIAALFAFLSVHITGFNDNGVSVPFALTSVLVTVLVGLFLVGPGFLKSRQAKHQSRSTGPNSRGKARPAKPALPPHSAVVQAAKVPANAKSLRDFPAGPSIRAGTDDKE